MYSRYKKNLFYATHKSVGFIWALDKCFINTADCCPADLPATQQMVYNLAAWYTLDETQSSHAHYTIHVWRFTLILWQSHPFIYTDTHSNRHMQTFYCFMARVSSCFHWLMTDLSEMLPSCFTATTECYSSNELSPHRHMSSVLWCWHGLNKHGLFTVMDGMFSAIIYAVG